MPRRLQEPGAAGASRRATSRKRSPHAHSPRRTRRRPPACRAQAACAEACAGGANECEPRRASRAARADVAAARAHRRAPRAVAVDGRDPHDVQRSEHAAGHRPAQPLQGSLREGARRQARLHGLLREGGRARAEEVSARQRVDRRRRHRLSRLLRHRHCCRQPARTCRADHSRRRPAVRSPTSRR